MSASTLTGRAASSVTPASNRDHVGHNRFHGHADTPALSGDGTAAHVHEPALKAHDTSTAHLHEHEHACSHGHGGHHQHVHTDHKGRFDPAGVAGVTLAVPVMVGADVRTAVRVLQMDCPTEEALIRKKLAAMSAVRNLEFNLMQRILTVDHAPDALEPVLEAIRSLGFTVEVREARAQAGVPAEASRKPWWPFALAGVAAVASEAVSWSGLPAWLPAVLAAVSVLACGLSTYRKGWIAIRNRNLNINALMSIAVTGAFALGQWPEAAMVMVLFTIAELIEAKSLDRARNAIQGLLQLAPQMATARQVDGSWLQMEASSVSVGATVRVKPGERLALDGVIIAGRSSINQSPITGESMPVEKAGGDRVFAGTINESGSFEYEVTAAAGETTLARIIRAVEQAQGAKAPTQRFVDQFARVYTPVVFAVALAVAVLPPIVAGGSWHDWLYRALVMLVIACPCALVISTPVSIVSGLAAAARHGILIKGGAHLEQGRKLAWLALDKTGTITLGRPVLTDMEARASVGPDRCRALAASLAGRSDHPVSLAIAGASDARHVHHLQVEDFEAIPGRGVRGTIEGISYVLGNHRLAEELGRCSTALEARVDELERQGKTVVMLIDESRVLALFAVADTVKATSRAAVAELHELGVRTAMLTGDNLHTARAVAAQVGVDRVEGDQLPEDKQAAVEALGAGGAMVGMVGDGINDAPALARASIGFAMGAMGTDAAIETADVALMDDDLRKIPTFIRLSRATHNVLVQNITVGLTIKAVFLTLTLGGSGTMWMAVFADVGASLLVVANGLRLLRK